jgi:tetratricopeptide (TPR) repeat protein
MALLHVFQSCAILGRYVMSPIRRNMKIERDDRALVPVEQSAPAIVFASLLEANASHKVQRMFRDPRVLEAHERGDLIAQLRKALQLAPEVAELRVLLGMALCVNLQAQDALEELSLAVEQAPSSFIARLKYGELLMRLRICQKAAEETQKAALLAANAAQSELARRQAATIRTMLREGIERGGYAGFLSRFLRFRRRSKNQTCAPLFVPTK